MVQEIAIELVVERFYAEALDQPMFAPIALMKVNTSKPAGVRQP